MTVQEDLSRIPTLEYISFTLQTIALAMAGWLLYASWRRAGAVSPAVKAIVSLGFIARSVLGAVLFWISYLDLPIARSMRTGGGFWFFALDGRMYFTYAVQASHNGLAAIALENRTLPSVFYIQMLALFAYLFGAVPSVAVLLNIFCFMGMVTLILKWGSSNGRRVGLAALVPLTAVAFSPSAILWSLQPLKDPLFMCLVVAVCVALAAWQETWRDSSSALPVKRLIGIALAILLVFYAIAAIRWYFALVAWTATFALAVILVAVTRRPRATCIAANVALLFAISQVLLWGGGPYIPDHVFTAVSAKRASLKSLVTLPSRLLSDVERSRRGFDRVGGATQIGAATPAGGSTAGKQQGVPVAPSASHSQPVSAQPQPAVTAARAPQVAGRETPSVPAVGKVAKPAVAPSPERQARVSPPEPFPLATRQPVAPRAVPVIESRKEIVVVPASKLSKFAAGLTAILIPKALAERLHLVDIGGGRGMWLFADLDTILFDAVLLIAFYAFCRAAATKSLGEPIFWHIAIMTVLLAVPLIYAVSNFGTLFRQREMIYIGLALTPLALARALAVPFRGNISADSTLAAKAAPVPQSIPPPPPPGERSAPSS